MELRRYWSLLRRWSWLIALFTLIFAGAAFLISSLSKPVYQASTTLLINQARNSSATPDYNSLLTSERLAKTYRELLRKRPVLEKVIQNLNLNVSPEDLARNTTVEIVRDTQLIVLSAEDTSPQRSALIANEIAKEFKNQNQDLQANRFSATKQSLQDELAKIQLDIVRTQNELDKVKGPTTPEQLADQNRLQTQLAGYRNSYANLLKSYEDARLAEAETVSTLSVVEEARVPEKPVRPNTLLTVALAAFIGLVAGLAMALVLEYLDDSVKSNEQATQITGASVLGIVSRFKGGEVPDKLVTIKHPNSAAAEGYRLLRANIEFSEVDNPITTLVITSSNAGEGKTTTSANLGVTLAQSGKRVILVDTDLRRPRLHQYFQQTNLRGVTSVLLEQSGTLADHLVSTGVPNLQLLASGPIPPNPAELLGSNRMAELIQELKTLADIIIFDTSPVLPVVDPTLIARYCDSTLLVVNTGSTRTVALKKAYNQLLQSGTRVLGVVMNNVVTSHAAYYYNASYYSALPSPDEQRRWRIPFIGGKQPESVVATVSNSPKPAATEATIISYADKPVAVNSFQKTSDIYRVYDNATATAPFIEVKTSPQKLLGYLEVKSGPSAGLQFGIRTNRVIVGRSVSSANLKQQLSVNSIRAEDGAVEGLEWFLVADDKVSRQHIEIISTPEGTFLRDFSSLNGTWLNGKLLKAQPVRLRDNSEIQLGYQTKLVYHQITA